MALVIAKIRGRTARSSRIAERDDVKGTILSSAVANVHGDRHSVANKVDKLKYRKFSRVAMATTLPQAWIWLTGRFEMPPGCPGRANLDHLASA